MEQPIYFPEQEAQQYGQDLQMQQLQNQNINLANALNSSSFGSNALNQNLIEFQLEAEKFSERLRHFIAGDEIQEKDGNISYVKQVNPQLVTLNELGVSVVMRFISGYITKETFLSVYSEERINEVIGELGQLLRVRIYSNASLFGLDSDYKFSDFSLLIFSVLVFIENAYRRALGGKEREGIREGRIVTQNQPLNYNGSMGGIPTSIMPKKKFNLFDKKTW